MYICVKNLKLYDFVLLMTTKMFQGFQTLGIKYNVIIPVIYTFVNLILEAFK